MIDRLFVVLVDAHEDGEPLFISDCLDEAIECAEDYCDNSEIHPDEITILEYEEGTFSRQIEMEEA